VVRVANKQFIFVVAGQTSDHYNFKKIEVTTGVSELGYIAIHTMTNLPENVKVVTKGAFYLESKLSGGEEGE